MRLSRAFVTVSFFTLISRISGYVRDIFIARYLGTGPLSEAFFVALKMPNFFRRLFAEGAFNAAFVPMFSAKLSTEGDSAAREFFERIFALLFFSLIIFTAVFVIIMPGVMFIMAPGFLDRADLLETTTELCRITFPYLILISLASLLGAVLNSYHKFSAFAFMPVFYNICLIFALVVGKDHFESPAHALSWGLILSGFVQIAWMVWFCNKEGFYFKLGIPKLTAEVKAFLRRFFPGVIGAGITQINLLVDVMIATFISSAISYLYYADRLMQLPLSLIGTAMGTALLPALSRYYSTGDRQNAVSVANKALLVTLILAVPSAAALITIPKELIGGLFESGKFDEASTNASAGALAAFAIGLPAFVLVKVFANIFFALKDTKTPVKISIVCLILNIVFNVIFIFTFPMLGIMSHIGIAFATSLAAWVNALAMFYILRKHGEFNFETELYKKGANVVFATLVMVAVLIGCKYVLPQNIIGVAIMCALGGTIYLAFCIALKAFSISEIKELLKRKKS
jgi:putative peptidoglycan lipid II flippase